MEIEKDHAARLGNTDYQGWDDYYRSLPPERVAWSGEADPVVAELIARAPNDESTVVLDLGCGDGRNLQPWCATRTQVIGADISPHALRLLLERITHKDLRRPLVLQASMTGLDCLIDNYVDIVQCIDALPQVANIERALIEIGRVLKPGGAAVFNVFTPDDCAFGEGEQVTDRLFRYKDTLFRFFIEGEIETILPPSLLVSELRRREWIDPPHIPFRPYEHTHAAFYYICTKAYI